MEKNNLYPDASDTAGFDQPPPSYNASVEMPGVNVAPTIIYQQTVDATLGPRPQIAMCRSCGHQGLTKVEYVSGNKTNIAALLMCIVGLWCCCCIPYCVNSLKNAMHYCSNCGNFMGVYDK